MRRLFFLILGMFTVGSSSFMIAGLLPKISQSIGQPISITAQGITAFSLTYLLSAPFFSMVFANKSSKRLFQIALTLFLFGNLITLFSYTIVGFVFGRIITALGAGIFNPLCVSIALHLSYNSPRGKTLSLIWGANSAGVVFGVPLGVYLSSKFHWQLAIAYVLIMGLITLIGFSLQNAELDFSTNASLKDRLRLLVDKRVLSIIGITCFTSLASLGLYSYVASIQSETSHSLAISLFFWGLGGFVGSSFVGFWIDFTKKPQAVMAFILVGLMLAIITIPITKDLPYFGLLSYFMWGVFGWAMPTPQQHILFQICESQKAILSALNSSAIGLGSSIGTAIGGAIIARGFNVADLPYLSAFLLIFVFFCQLMLINRSKLRSLLV